jgi:ankyrin repeat protein
LASKEGHITVVKELLERNVHVDAASKKGNTALYIACLAGQQQVVELFVKNNANFEWFYTTLHVSTTKKLKRVLFRFIGC